MKKKILWPSACLSGDPVGKPAYEGRTVSEKVEMRSRVRMIQNFTELIKNSQFVKPDQLERMCE